jgi:hypothetical protein
MSALLVVCVSGGCLVLLGIEAAHVKWSDHRQRKDVLRSWVMCVRSVARSNTWLPTQEAIRLAELEFSKLNARRREHGRSYLPRHLVGVPVRVLLDAA